MTQVHDDHHDDEIGVLLDAEGNVPAEAHGRHCKHCGEEIIVTLGHGGPAQPLSVQEYVHRASRLAHCVFGWTNGIADMLSDSTAAPCWKPGCLSNAEHAARSKGQ